MTTPDIPYFSSHTTSCVEDREREGPDNPLAEHCLSQAKRGWNSSHWQQDLQMMRLSGYTPVSEGAFHRIADDRWYGKSEKRPQS